MKIISSRQYLEQWQEDTARVEILHDHNEFDFWGRGNGKWSENELRCIHLRSGLTLEVEREKFHRDLGLRNTHSAEDIGIVAKFFLSGTLSTISPPGIENVEANYQERAGQSYLFYLPDMEETEQMLGGDHLHVVRILMTADLVSSFSADLGLLPQPLKLLLEGRKAPRFHRPVGAMTLDIQTALHQIVNAPYHGIVQRMYLESKAIELLALQMAQLIEADNGKQEATYGLKSVDIERIHYAKEILIQNWISPPSLEDLAHQVGLNDFKLKKGFRQIFGTTAFKYLQNYRLEQAEQLLKSENTSVTEVARSVGYADITAFARAFKRKYGVTPKEYQKTWR